MKTGASDEFKNLEMEMNLRHEGTHQTAPAAATGRELI